MSKGYDYKSTYIVTFLQKNKNTLREKVIGIITNDDIQELIINRVSAKKG